MISGIARRKKKYSVNINSESDQIIASDRWPFLNICIYLYSCCFSLQHTLCYPRKPLFSEKIRSKHCITKHTTRLTADLKKTTTVIIPVQFIAKNNQYSQLRNVLMVYALIAQLSSFSRRALSGVQM